ncbi:hypothetical protein HDV06_000679 [Boothiomyces sp. JEL0866]|nr:hypothetical protein HDV06_000679 [Boothiomyces sp. JEL0866]
MLARLSKNTRISRISKLNIRGFASHHHHDDHEVESPIHKDEYLKIANNWPHEHFAPEHYLQGEQAEYETTPEMLDLIASSHAEPEPETFFTPFFRNLLLAGVVGLGLYRVNEYYAHDKPVHPITAFIQDYQKKFNDITENDRQVAINMKKAQQYADDQLIFNSAPKKQSPVYRWNGPVFERASDFIVPLGQVDVSDVKIKHSWQINDDVLGVPFPDKE